MEVSSKAFREVEFREKMRGYHPEDVDQFLEQMATAVDGLQDRLQKAVERAQRAEASAAEAGSSDEALRRTLVLAQRTADLAVQEAREQASRIVASAEQQAQSTVTEAEDRARRLHGEALADVHAELAKLEATRAQAQQEVDALSRWANEHRAHLATTLRDALAMIERAGVLTPAPTSSPIDVPFAAPRATPPSALPPGTEPPPAPDRPSAERPPTDRPPVERPPTEARTRDRAPSPDPGPVTEAVQVVPSNGNASTEGGGRTDTPPTGTTAVASEDDDRERNLLTEPDEEALDNFFEEGEFENEPRFGGRLRRRR
jgi:DivIVA domain-containing protein